MNEQRNFPNLNGSAQAAAELDQEAELAVEGGYAQRYQDARIAALPAIYKTTHERLACELALELEEPEEVFSRYGYTIEQGIALLETPLFAALCAKVGQEIRESGLSFKIKCRVQAEELLTHSFAIATDPLATTAERVKIIQWTAKMAGLEPKADKDDGKTGGGLNLSITFAGQPPMKVVNGEPLTIEQEN